MGMGGGFTIEISGCACIVNHESSILEGEDSVDISECVCIVNHESSILPK